MGDVIDSAVPWTAEKDYLKRVAKEFALSARQAPFCAWKPLRRKPDETGISGHRRAREVVLLIRRKRLPFCDPRCLLQPGWSIVWSQEFQRGDANIPPAEMDWLRADLQPDGAQDHRLRPSVPRPVPALRRADCTAVRSVLEKSGKVIGVLQGHFHWGNYGEIRGIHYCTIQAIVEGSGAGEQRSCHAGHPAGRCHSRHRFPKAEELRWPTS